MPTPPFPMKYLSPRGVTGFFLFVLFGVFSNAMSAEPVRVRLATNLGDIVLALDAEKAPETVRNFLDYVDSGHYDGVIFHRVIPNFMIQGGGYTENYKKKPTRSPIENEADNGLENVRGTIAMARTGDPHSASAQFFINVVDNDFLDYRGSHPRGWGYAVFGRVISGMAVADKISRLPTGPGGRFSKDVPKSPVVILVAARVSGRVPDGALPKTREGSKTR